jgi:hypothetical protein
MDAIIAKNQQVLNQYAYVLFYDGHPIQIMQAVERELTENPSRPQVEYLHIERGAYPSGDGHAKFILPGHAKYRV